MKKFGFHKSTSNLYDGGSNGGNLARSSSLHDLHDVHSNGVSASSGGMYGGRGGGMGGSISDLSRTRSTADLMSPLSRAWRGSGLDLTSGDPGASSSGAAKPAGLRLSSLISLTGSCSDLGYTSAASSRRASLAVRF